MSFLPYAAATFVYCPQ